MLVRMRITSMTLAGSLVTLLPAAAAAQTAPWNPAPPTPTAVVVASVTPSAPAAPEAAPEAEPEVRYDPNPGSRYALEALAGLGMGVGGGLVTLLGAGLMAASSSLSERDVPVAALVGTSLVFLGIPFGVVLMGNARGGNGVYGWSLLGMVAGSAVGSLMFLPIVSACQDTSKPSCAVAAVLGSTLMLGTILTGAVLGYELSSDQRHLSPPRTPARARWIPTAIPTRGGLTLGVAGVF